MLALDHDPGALAAASDAAAFAADAGMAFDEAVALHALAVARPTDRSALRPMSGRLTELTAASDSKLVAAIGQQVAAMAAGDGAALDAASHGYEVLDALLFAAETCALAAEVHARAGEPRAAQASTRRAQSLAARCEGARIAALDRLAAPPGLTARELEIARLAAAGTPSKEIAEHLVVSVRTVDSHLYRVYAKLGVTNRAELAAALGAPIG